MTLHPPPNLHLLPPVPGPYIPIHHINPPQSPPQPHNSSRRRKEKAKGGEWDQYHAEQSRPKDRAFVPPAVPASPRLASSPNTQRAGERPRSSPRSFHRRAPSSLVYSTHAGLRSLVLSGGGQRLAGFQLGGRDAPTLVMSTPSPVRTAISALQGPVQHSAPGRTENDRKDIRPPSVIMAMRWRPMLNARGTQQMEIAAAPSFINTCG
ncbi:hypothetical protein DPEC_G00165210 [Dallia pectoralis]|uniref:Uncharacterized protein n=1 Tax=Dallia pectoralis TaxID=75939 RepID=A0ACC2GHR6_DALPE|nr:hypothetical protein DPEC_G00165210 [Dallia pectoralis]